MAVTSPNTVVGYFSTHTQAHAAVEALEAEGFQAREVGVAARGSWANDQSSTGSSAAGTENVSGRTTTSSTHTAGTEGVGMWDKIKNFFEGNDTPEPYVNESARGAADSREVTYDQYGSEDVQNSLSGLSVPEEHSRYFGQKFNSDSEGAVVTVTTNDRQEQARAILKRCGADLGESAANYQEDTSEYGRRSTKDTVADEQNIRLYGEVLRVHKDRINRGEVRVRKEVKTDTQTIQVPTTREELVIERRAATGEPAGNDASFGEQEIRIPLSEERASVDKQAVVTEEVRLGKREVTSVQSVNEQVRREELTVDDPTRQESTRQESKTA